MKWKIDKIESLVGKTILVTGGNSGLGYESVKMFSSKGAHVIMATRSLERGEKAKKTIIEAFPNADIHIMQLDLASKESIHNFGKAFTKEYSKLDILLNNAGIMTTPYGLTADGIEQQTGVNHFGHFLLTSLLFDTIKKTKDARIVNVSSLAHKAGKIDFNNLFYEKKGYTKIKAYCRSKLENLLFTYELQRRVEKAGLDIKVLVAHPGVAKTNLGRHIRKSFMSKALDVFQKFFSHDAYHGAMPQVRAALDVNAKSGEFYGPDWFFQVKGNPVIVKSNKRSHNKELALKLWDASEKTMGVTFTI